MATPLGALGEREVTPMRIPLAPMAEWDPKSGKVRPTWTVRFGAGSILLGCTIAAVTTAVVLFFTLVTGPGLDQLADAGSVAGAASSFLG